MYLNNQKNLYENKYAGKDIDKIIVGPDIKYIPENCFNDCKNLKEITFEGNIIDIEAAAFMGCKNLKTINANNINIIKDFAFYGCDNIINFNIDENIANNIKFGFYNDILSTYFELPEIGRTFNEVSWRKINMISEQGLAKNYFKVGDEKVLQIGSETYHVQILGFNHDNKSDGSGKAGITAQLKEVMTTGYGMNPTKHFMISAENNIGGWKNSGMRTYAHNNVYNSLPSDLQAVIKTVDKISDAGNRDKTTLNTTEDKLFLLSLEEVGFTTSDNKYFVSGQGTKYEYFTDNVSRIKYLSGDYTFWWLRSAFTNNTYSFCSVSYLGCASINFASSTIGVAPAFCI